MKTHTNNFKNNLIKFGRELDSKITYTQNGTQVELGVEDLNSITPHYEGGILKSVMKQLDIDSNVEIPLNTVINFQFGVKTSNEEVQDYRDNYDYINFGNYVVYNVEKQEDTGSYKITCYDKMLYSMKDYESVGVTYPITIRSYINAICTHLGLTFSNINDTFANYNREIQNELYLDADNNTLGFTFRDVLDQLAQVTASTICINEDDELEIRYINNTNDTINEEYLKDINVNFGEQYGPINTIVLSRSAGSDNIYYPAILPNNPNEIKISDNQIMNFNDRADYLPDIYAKLNGLQYYLNDFASTGITYYDICDRYNVQIGENTYPCIMFNDEINITQGLEENIHTDMPEESETDYTKADKTDRKINQTYLIVNKQLGIIEAKVDEVANISTDASGYGSVTLENIADSEPIEVVVKAIREDISYLYPRNDLFPSDDLYPKERNILFTNGENIITYTIPDDLLHYSDSIYDEFHLDFLNKKCQIIKKCEKKNVVITNNVNLSGVSITFNNSSFLNFYSYMTEELFDSLLNNTLKIIKSDDDHFIGARINRISGSYYTFTIYIFDYDGSYDIFEQEIYRTTNTVGEVVLEPMSTPTLEINEYDLSSDFGTTTEVTSNSLFLNCFTYPDGRIYPKQTIEIIDYEYPTIHLTEGNWTVSLPSFSTSYVYAKMMIKNDYTSQTASKVELNSQITQTKNNINLELSEVLDGDNKVTGASLMLAINNDESEAKLEADKIALTANDVLDIIAGNAINLSTKNLSISSDYLNISKNGTFRLSSTENYPRMIISASSSGIKGYLYNDGIRFGYEDSDYSLSSLTDRSLKLNESDRSNTVILNTYQMGFLSESGVDSDITMINRHRIEAPTIVQTSLEESKKDFELFYNALEEIKKIDIYKYHLKSENDTDKKHLGFVIGDKFNYSSLITAVDENGEEIGVDNYSMTSLCLQAIKEQQEQINQLKEEINKLKGDEN